MSSFGPFETYAPPGVYATTVVEQDAVVNAAGLRIPVLIGTGAEVIRVNDFEIVRGSSSFIDNEIFEEDLASQIDGVSNSFTLKKFPVVKGDGTGVLSNDPDDVVVQLNGERVIVNALLGATGEIILAVIPLIGDTLTVNYFFNKTDTKVIDEDLSAQADSSNRVFKTNFKPIVLGDNGGKTTNDPERVVVTVDAISATVSEVDGANGLITLETAPAGGSTVLVTYFTNVHANTSDLLPKSVVNTVRVGLTEGRDDFIENVDYVVRGNQIFWGTTFRLESDSQNTLPSTEAVDSDFITLTQFDNRRRLAKVAIGDGVTKTFVLPNTPVDGTGFDVNTDELVDIEVFVGPDVATAVTSGAVVVKTLNSTTRVVELSTAPAIGSVVLVSFWENLMADDIFDIEVTSLVPDEYSVSSRTLGKILFGVENTGSHVVADGAFGVEGVTFPGAFLDLETIPGSSKAEVMTVTFQTADRYFVTSNRTAADGSRTGGGTTGVGGDLVAAVGSTDFSVTGTTATLTLTAALVGTDGNDIRVRLVDPGAVNASEVVTVSGTDIEVLLANPTGSAVTSTAASIDTALGLSGPASVLIGSVASGVDAGTDIATPQTIALSGGNPRNGHLDQTFVDPLTGVRFTVLSPTSFSYAAADTLEFETKETFSVQSFPTLSVPGLQMTVTSLTGTAVTNVGILETFDKSGSEPGVGDIFFISFEFAKEDFSTRFHSSLSKVQREFGDLSVENPLVIGWFLANRNGSPIVGLKQVRKAPNSNQATDVAFMDALKELEKDQRGNPNIKVITPLTTSTDVFDDLKAHTTKMSSQRFRRNRRGIFGVSIGTTPDKAKDIALALNSERLTMLYPDGIIFPIVDDQGFESEVILDGSFLAASFAGLDVSPTFDVAEAMTNKELVGFRRLARTLDEVEMNQVAVAGVTVIQQLEPIFRVRQAFTTSVGTVLSQTPGVAKISDFVEEGIETALQRFIGLKGVEDRLADIEDAGAGVLVQFRDQEIIRAFRNISASFDPIDPRIVRFEAQYAPVLPILWITAVLRIRVS